MTIEIARKALAARLLDQEADDASTSTHGDAVTIEVPVRLRRRGVEAKLVVPNLTDAASDPDPSLVKLLARAHEWFGQILRGEVKDFQAIATAEKLNRSYVSRALSLAFLPPATIKAILAGRQPPELTAKRLLRCAHNLPLVWAAESLFGTDE